MESFEAAVEVEEAEEEGGGEEEEEEEEVAGRWVVVCGGVRKQKHMQLTLERLKALWQEKHGGGGWGGGG